MAYWYGAVGVILVIQTLFLWVGRRCSSHTLSHWDGLLGISESMTTGWFLIDVLVAVLATMVAMVASTILAVLPDSSGKYGRFVAAVKRFRMEQ